MSTTVELLRVQEEKAVLQARLDALEAESWSECGVLVAGSIRVTSWRVWRMQWRRRGGGDR